MVMAMFMSFRSAEQSKHRQEKNKEKKKGVKKTKPYTPIPAPKDPTVPMITIAPISNIAVPSNEIVL